MKAIELIVASFEDELEKIAGAEAFIEAGLQRIGVKGAKNVFENLGDWLGRPVREAWEGVKVLTTKKKDLLQQAHKLREQKGFLPYKVVEEGGKKVRKPITDEELVKAIRGQAWRAVGRGGTVAAGLGGIGWMITPSKQE